MKKALGFVFYILIFGSNSILHAQGASCSAAVSLTLNANPITGIANDTTVNDPTAASCITGTIVQDGWYSFVANNANATVTVVSSNRQLVIYAYSGMCGSLTQISCANTNTTAGGQTETMNLTGLINGSKYYVRVANTGAGTSITLNAVSVTSPPANSSCATAALLPCSTTNMAGTTVSTNGSTSSVSGCSISNYGVWYTFTGDGQQTTISSTASASFDHEMAIVSGNCSSLTNVACQDIGLGGGNETYTFTTAVGVTYYVYIAYWSSAGTSTNTGTFTISRSCSVPFNPCTSISNIANCGSANSVTIPAGAGGYSPSSCGWTTPGVERIYTFTPASTGNFSITQTSSFGYIDYQFKPVSSGCSSSGWTCIDDILGAGTSPSFSLTAGTQYYILLDPEVSTGGSVNFTINCPTPPLTNDDSCNAIPLPVSSACSYLTYTNSSATPSPGAPLPICASYFGGDVWFSAVVPATGVLTVDLQSGVMTDSGMAFYSGTCSSLTLLECDDDDSANGLMSNITLTGLTPGQVIFIRVWEYGNDNNGIFGICATTPSCPPPSDLQSNILSTTSATINWSNTAPPSSNGYQYYLAATNSPPLNSSIPNGSTSSGVNSVTFTALTAGQSYYFWVRAFCGGSDFSSWIGPINFTLCGVGNGSGTTTLDCPNIAVGGLGLSGLNPPAVPCSSNTCTDLEANYLQISQPTNYAATSIPYAPPYQFGCLKNPVSVNIDDRWSQIINLPFNFCFFGNNYDKCLISSNGVITFDTTNNAPGGYSTWSFISNLPNTSLFKNTIFGVYHDIDPSIGGEVGWELITLNTGCRALVASWNNIPMFSSTCNSSLYTGMIVLYENTNIIDVFIKEKNVCDSWNDGNAIVGIQDGSGTTAVVASDRNGLSANWAVTNEAWRFTPNGSTLTTIQWYEGNGTSGTSLGNTNTINVCPSATTTYTAEVTYALCNGTNLKLSDNVVVTVDGGKVWDGSTNSNWNISENWTPPGVPTSVNCIVIPDVLNDPILSSTPNGVGYNLLLHSNANLTLNTNQNLTITDKVVVQPNGIFTINNSASLIQINNSINSGNITYKRDSPTVRTLDYSYWSSPVAGFNINNIVLPHSFGPIFTWNTTVGNSNGYQGNWQSASGSSMIAGKGYIARAPSSAPFNNTTPNILSGRFTGVPNNGTINVPINRGSDENQDLHHGLNGEQVTNFSDNFNLLGNPYPSAISASNFLIANATKIEGNIKLWTHGSLPSLLTPSPFYSSYVSNYTPSDYLTYNFTGTSCCPTAAPDLHIGAGQGFFVQMKDGPQSIGVESVSFDNGLRSANYNNSVFFRTQNNTTSSINDVSSMERNRIWLDLTDPNSQTDRTLVGYIENATMQRDSFFDSITENTGGTLIWSLIGDTKLNIQGRILPFDINDEIPIGVNITNLGNYTIGIAAVDGLFSTQNIYLKDALLNLTHDINATPYNFNSQIGEINNRFKLVYKNSTLDIVDHSNNYTTAFISNNIIKIQSEAFIEEISVYDITGKLVNTFLLEGNKNQFSSNFNFANGVYIAKITLTNKIVVNKKLIN